MLMALAAGLTLVPTPTVAAREVLIGDLVRDRNGRGMSGPTAERIALRLPAGRRSVTLPASLITTLIKRQAPFLAVAGAGDVTIVLRSPGRNAASCWSSNRQLDAGEAITVRDVTPGTCEGEPAAADILSGRDALPRVRLAVPAGTALGRLVPASADRVAAGTPLTLRSVMGPVAVEREVVTLQTGRSGRRVFVRDGGGQVFAAPLLLEEAR